MRSKRWIAALAASGVLWASAHAADEPPVQAPPGIPPGIIIFELQPAQPGTVPDGQPPQASEPGAAQAQEQAMLSMLLLHCREWKARPAAAAEVEPSRCSNCPPTPSGSKFPKA